MKKLILVIAVLGLVSCKKNNTENYLNGYCRIENGIGIWMTKHDSLNPNKFVNQVSVCLEDNGKWIEKTDSIGFYSKL